MLGQHKHTWRLSFPSVWRVSPFKDLCSKFKTTDDSLRSHSTEVGNTCSPWALPAPDLSHSRSQWPSACLPSCQAAPSQTCCRHADNKETQQGEEQEERRQKRDFELKLKLRGAREMMENKWQDKQGRTQYSSYRKPPIPEGQKMKETEGERVHFMSSVISFFLLFFGCKHNTTMPAVHFGSSLFFFLVGTLVHRLMCFFWSGG